MTSSPQVWELLLLADPNKEAVQSYLDAGQGFMIRDEEGPLGVVVIHPSGLEELEIMNVAVAPRGEHQGHGQYLLHHVETFARAQGYLRLRIATANSSIRQLKIYQRAGFYMDRLVKGYFLQPGYPADMWEEGIATRDRIELVKPLA